MSGWNSFLCNVFADGARGIICAYFCLPCYLAETRQAFDGSNWFLNCICLGDRPLVIRNIIREGYGITSNCFMDALIGCCLGPCAAIQMANEVKIRGRCKTNVNQQANVAVNIVNTVRERQNGWDHITETLLTLLRSKTIHKMNDLNLLDCDECTAKHFVTTFWNEHVYAFDLWCHLILSHFRSTVFDWIWSNYNLMGTRNK